MQKEMVFPGLIADYYNGTIVLQAHSVGMYLHFDLFKEILKGFAW